MSLSAKPEKVRQINIPILKTQYSTCRTNYGQRAEEPAGNSQYCRLVPSPITARGCYARLRSMNSAPAAAASRATAPAMAATLEPVLATVFLLPLPVAPGL